MWFGTNRQTFDLRSPEDRLYARYLITEDDFAEIKQTVLTAGELTKNFLIQWVDKDNVVHAEIVRECYIADKKFYQNKKGDSQRAKLTFKRSEK
jgi:hypothetical protein